MSGIERNMWGQGYGQRLGNVEILKGVSPVNVLTLLTLSLRPDASHSSQSCYSAILLRALNK